VLERVLGVLKDLEPCQTELPLVRALQAIENLTDIARRPRSLGDPGDDPILKMHSEILNKLISIHEAHGDLPEAERLLGQLAALPGGATVPAHPKISTRLAESLLMTSDRSREVFGNLKIPKEYTDSLHFNETGPFPPTHRAVLDHIPDVIRHLCKTPQRVLAETDILRRKIVHIAAETANLDLLDLITHQRQPLMKSRDIYQKTPLCVAAYCGHPGFFERLVNDGADLETRNEDGRTLLCIASGAGHLSIVEFLLARGISPNDDRLRCWSPLHAAAHGGHYEICKALLDHGAWANWLSDFRTAAQVSVQGCDPRIIAMLRDAEQHPRNQFPRSDLRSRLEQPQPPPTPCTSLPIPTETPPLSPTACTPSLPHQLSIEDGHHCVADTSSVGKVFEFNDIPGSDSRSFSEENVLTPQTVMISTPQSYAAFLFSSCLISWKSFCSYNYTKCLRRSPCRPH
jgi:ankyrin repeat protein